MPGLFTVVWAGGSVRAKPGAKLSDVLNHRGEATESPSAVMGSPGAMTESPSAVMEVPDAVKAVPHGAVVETPCGGQGLCGKCIIKVLEGHAPPTDADLAFLTQSQIEAGYRLACRLSLTSDLKIELLSSDSGELAITVGNVERRLPTSVGVAVDIGTTAIEASLCDLETGEEIASGRMPNPQAVHGADLMSRLAYAIGDKSAAESLQKTVLGGVQRLVSALCQRFWVGPESIKIGVLVGNTAMHHLALGLDVSKLAVFPYIAGDKTALTIDLRVPGDSASAGVSFYAPSVISGMVGSDAVAVLVAVGPTDTTRLIVDIGTNTEALLQHGCALYVASAPAGPAFEGGGISQGMRAAPGAIDSVTLSGDDLDVTTIGGGAPLGLSGSGLVDAIASLLESGVLDENGLIRSHGPLAHKVFGDRAPHTVEIAPGVSLTQQDVRAFQLAKSAVRCAVDALLESAGISVFDVDEVVVAGAFGTALNIDSAFVTGMLPDFGKDKVRLAGNLALAGAKMILCLPSARKVARKIADTASYVELSSRPRFQEQFLQTLQFPMAMPKGSRLP